MGEDAIREYSQKQEIEILDEVQRICIKYQFNYFVTAGTLLGTIRHKGFIPWDDDIDIAMPRKDFERFKKVCAIELNNTLFYQDSYTDSCYPFYFAKIRKNKTEVDEPWLRNIPMHKGIYIDIFPLDICPQSDTAATVFFKFIEILTFAAIGKVDSTYRCGYQKAYVKILYMILRKMPLTLLFKVRENIRKIVEFTCSHSRLCTVGGAHGYPRETYSAEWFKQSVEGDFEEHKVPIPVGWDEVLTHMYGDYMVPPSENNRSGHFS